MHNQPSDLWADIKALECFPYAGAARSFTHPDARKRFIDRAQHNLMCPYKVLRGIVGRTHNS